MDILDFYKADNEDHKENPNIPLEHIPGIHRLLNERSSFIIGLGFGVWGMLQNS